MVQDKILTCKECGKEFVFTVSEQDFYQSKGFANEPSRCSECRAVRKQQKNNSQAYGGERPMYPAICAKCGKETMVPFKPTGDKPVYCRDCYRLMRQ